MPPPATFALLPSRRQGGAVSGGEFPLIGYWHLLLADVCCLETPQAMFTALRSLKRSSLCAVRLEVEECGNECRKRGSRRRETSRLHGYACACVLLLAVRLVLLRGLRGTGCSTDGFLAPALRHYPCSSSGDCVPRGHDLRCCSVLALLRRTNWRWSRHRQLLCVESRRWPGSHRDSYWASRRWDRLHNKWRISVHGAVYRRFHSQQHPLG